MVKWYTFFYWIDMLVSTTTTIIFSIQWFVFTDHSLPELADQPEKLREHDSSFNSEKIVSIVILCLLRIIHVYFACIMTAYASSLGKSHYSKLASDIDEELNFPGYDEMADVNDHTESDHVRLLSKNQ
ncbi:hypothetical protein BDB01DRAFT_731792 [Pilobolus umbonatus]|nr:hypothetical protein BDB01DRAFT_731792 [Pilobolus umbonatus]